MTSSRMARSTSDCCARVISALHARNAPAAFPPIVGRRGRSRQQGFGSHDCVHQPISKARRALNGAPSMNNSAARWRPMASGKSTVDAASGTIPRLMKALPASHPQLRTPDHSATKSWCDSYRQTLDGGHDGLPGPGHRVNETHRRGMACSFTASSESLPGRCPREAAPLACNKITRRRHPLPLAPTRRECVVHVRGDAFFLSGRLMAMRCTAPSVRFRCGSWCCPRQPALYAKRNERVQRHQHSEWLIHHTYLS